MTEGKCIICQKPAPATCSLCNIAHYCGKEHQKEDWKAHKSICVPFKIETSMRYGRYLVATRLIKEGEIIMKKTPLITSPKIASFPICLGCHKKLNTNQKLYKCTKCKWPLCQINCEASELHKSECKIFKHNRYHPNIENSNTKQGIYALIAPLRALIIKKVDKSKFNALMSMQSHYEDNKDSQLYRMFALNLIPILKSLKLEIITGEVLTICSIFDTNAFEIRDTDGFINIRGLYPMVSLISHDCTINSKHSFHGLEHEIHVIATKDIEKGESITTTYTQTLWGTLNRRLHLKQAKNFDCICQRCADPSELGTYAGSFYCQSCRSDDKTQKCPKIVSMDPLDANADWRCEKCDLLVSGKKVTWRNDDLKKEISAIERSPIYFEMFLDKFKDLLHPSNCHVLEIKYALTQMYGNSKGFILEDISDDLLNRKIFLCNELLEIANILESGCSRFRGKLLFDLQAAIAIKAKRNFSDNKITIVEAKVMKRRLKRSHFSRNQDLRNMFRIEDLLPYYNN